MHWRPFRGRGSGLRACPWCRSAYVVPVGFHVADDEHWWIRLRCGECQRAREVTVSGDEAQRYDRQLGRSVARLKKMLEAIDRDAMEHELSTLVSALRHDLIGASDFARGGAG